MKRILMGVLTIAVVGGLIGAGVVAYFSDTETSAENVFQAGIIDQTVNGKDDPVGAVVHLEDMKPCDWEERTVTLRKKANSNPGPAYLHFDVKEWGNAIESEPGNPNANKIHNWITVDLKINGVVLIPPEAHFKLGDLHCCWIPLAWLDSKIEVVLSFHLQAETPNDFQGDFVGFNIDFMMTDHNMPAPVPNLIVLENKNPSTWEPIDDKTWGLAVYHASDLSLLVYAQGLTADTDYQVSINSPEKADWYPVSGGDSMRKEMASALASGSYSTTPGTAPGSSDYNLFERGYSGAVLKGTYVEGDTGCFTTSQNGVTPRTITTDGTGCFTAKVDFPLPDGDYEYIKVLVKEDFGSWPTILMEKDTTMFFTIP